MKIAFDGQVFSKQQYGGISRYIVELANGINQHSHEARIFAPFHKNEYLATLADENGNRTNPISRLKKPRRLIRFLNRQIGSRQLSNWQPDIIHLSSYWKSIDLKKPLPVVVTVHDMIQELFPNQFKKPEVQTEAKRRAVEEADHVICISNNTRKDLLELFNPDPSKVSVAHSGVSPLPELESPIDLPKNYLLYVGKRGGYKNFAGMLKAFASSKKLSGDFSLVAFGGRAFDSQEMALIQSLGLKSGQVVQISGNDAVLGACYRNAAAFVNPSLYEGFGLPPLEAMISDCPVISSHSSAMPEVIQDAGQFFDPTDSDSIVSAIESVVYNHSRREELIGKGRARSRALSWKNCAHETLEIYRKLI